MMTSPSVWLWIGFHLFILFILGLDLFWVNRNSHEVKFKEALGWCLFVFTLAILFDSGVAFFAGFEKGLEFLTAYLVELSLSIDNLFVFLTIFKSFQVPAAYQHQVLFWGILGALAMRALFIVLGISIIAKFEAFLAVFGVLLIGTGIRLAVKPREEPELQKLWILRLAKKILPFSDQYEGSKFMVRNPQGKWQFTPLFMVIIVIEAVDVIFATDSVPAVLGITRDPFIAYTSNVFAILGLRSLFFLISGLLDLFRFLEYGLAAALVFIGVKLCLSGHVHIPVSISLGALALFIGTSIFASLLFPAKKSDE